MNTNDRKKIIFAIATTAVLISVAFGVFIYNNGSTSSIIRKSGNFGPKVILNVLQTQFGNNSSSIPLNESIHVQVSSIIPSFLSQNVSTNAGLMQAYQTDNGVQDVLLNATLNSTHSVLFLNPEILNISREWKTFFRSYSGTNLPSLSVLAYKTVQNGSNISIYSYYNNIAYNPLNLKDLNASTLNNSVIKSWFNNTCVNPTSYSGIMFSPEMVFLNLSFSKVPMQILHSSANIHKAIMNDIGEITVSPQTTYETYFNTTSYQTNSTVVNVNKTTGVLPLLSVGITQGADNGYSEIVASGDVNILNGTIGLNSANGYESSTGEISGTMSSTPSFEHTANVTVVSSVNQTGAFPINLSEYNKYPYWDAVNRTILMIGIENATYTFSHYNLYTTKYTDEYEKITYVTYVNGHYETNSHTVLISKNNDGTTYDGSGTVGGISAIGGINGLKVEAMLVPFEVGIVVQKLLQNHIGYYNASLNDSGRNTAYQESTLWAHTSGYTNAAGVIKQASNAFKTFSSALELGLAISDVLAAANVFESDIPEVVSDSIEMVSDALDMSAAILNMFSTISFVSNVKSAFINSGFSNVGVEYPGSNFTFSFYNSTTPLSFTIGSNTYNFYAPLDYVNITSIYYG
jgi:hypothetical protein